MAFNITFKTPEGTAQTIECQDDQYLLDAAEEAGIDMNYSCRAGACSSCAGKIEVGTVTNQINLSLTMIRLMQGLSSHVLLTQHQTVQS